MIAIKLFFLKLIMFIIAIVAIFCTIGISACISIKDNSGALYFFIVMTVLSFWFFFLTRRKYKNTISAVESVPILPDTNMEDITPPVIKKTENIEAVSDDPLPSFVDDPLPDEEDQKPRSHTHKKRSPSSSHSRTSRSLKSLLAELNDLVGLDGVKSEIMQLVNFLSVQQLRASKGLPVVPFSMHLVFSGNPGTGKTTVARLIAQIYHALGIVSRGNFVETDRAGLVAGYIGQTALKVTDVVNEALGGVLFIDEAYTLAGDYENDFGLEAIDTLLKLMEDNRDDFAVIVAGYTDKMTLFINSNPGMRSRFSQYINFEDYTPEQLTAIFKLSCKENKLILSSTANEKVNTLFKAHHSNRDKSFGNGRLARNIFEETIKNQASRITSLSDVSEIMLSTIEADDIPDIEIIESSSEIKNFVTNPETKSTNVLTENQAGLGEFENNFLDSCALDEKDYFCKLFHFVQDNSISIRPGKKGFAIIGEHGRSIMNFSPTNSHRNHEVIKRNITPEATMRLSEFFHSVSPSQALRQTEDSLLFHTTDIEFPRLCELMLLLLSSTSSSHNDITE